MNTKIFFKTFLVTCLITLIPFMSHASVQLNNTSDDDSERIELNTSEWSTKPATRSLQAPFTAVIESGVLTIQSEDVSCDLTISVTDCQSGNAIYTMEVPQGNGSLIVIPTDGWGSGRYCLTISNPEMGYVFGFFSL